MNYKQKYLKHFGYGEGDFVRCEYCPKGAVDIHHIEKRGMGGKKANIDRIENLIALCRYDHDRAEGKIEGKFISAEELYKITAKRL